MYRSKFFTSACYIWESVDGASDSEGAYSSFKECPCYLDNLLFIGTIEDTKYATPPECGKI